MRDSLMSQLLRLWSLQRAAVFVGKVGWADAAISVGGRRSMKQGAESPLVTTGLEQFRDAATWQSVITNLTSSAAAYEVHGYGGASLLRMISTTPVLALIFPVPM